MAGWLPVEYIFKNLPGMVWPQNPKRGSVRWLKFGSRPLAEPFFRQSVSRLVQEGSPAETVTSLGQLLGPGGERAPPRGFILHMSRCGSTLAANALRAITGLQVVAEAQPVNQIFMPTLCEDGAISFRDFDETRVRLAASLFHLYSTYRTGSPEPTIIKFTSQNSLCMPEICRHWPEVPAIFIIRNPLEVLVSNAMETVPDFFVQSPLSVYAACGVGLPDKGQKPSYVDFSARILGRYLNEALSSLGPKVRIVDYDDIGAGSVHAMAAHFGTEMCGRKGLLDKVFKFYSKDDTGVRPYHDDRVRKRSFVNAEVFAAAERWIFPQYNKLWSLRSWAA